MPKLAMARVIFCPILSDILPETRVPTIPKNCKTEIEIPAYQRDSP